jgi:hypothetical protein
LSLPFRCAEASAEREETLVGTASTVRAFLLVENPGPWGVDAVTGSRLPVAVKRWLTAQGRRHGVRALLIRRHGRSTPAGPTVFAAYADASAPWVETTSLTDPLELLDMDLATLGAGHSLGLKAHRDPLYLVCTHGRHDLCCAERGRPIASALTARQPDQTWEVSHIGGDRFAGNLLVLPHGLYYGRLTPDDAVRVAERHTTGLLDLDHLRGRCGYPFAVQAAEIFLRRETRDTGIGALRLTGSTRTGDETTARFTGRTGEWQVKVQSSRSAAEQLTCRAASPSPGTSHALVRITAL